MKKVLLLLVFGSSVALASAQTTFGVKAGANFATITDASGAKTKVGIVGGLQANLHLSSMFSFAPEAVYSSQGAKATGETVNLNYINVPLLLQYNNESGFFAHTGPQIGFLMSAKDKADGSGSTDIKDVMNSTDFAWVIGAGFATHSGFGFNARYNYGFSKIFKSDVGSNSKNSVIQAGVFYNFSSGGSAKK